jgi:hypothetical protein
VQAVVDQTMEPTAASLWLRPSAGTVASGPQVPPAGSKVEPLPVQTAVRSAQSDQSWGIADGVQVLWWRTPVSVIGRCNSAAGEDHDWIGSHQPARVRSGMPRGTGRDRAAWFTMLNYR